MLGWLITAYFLSQNTIHSTSRVLFILSAEHALSLGDENQFVLKCLNRHRKCASASPYNGDRILMSLRTDNRCNSNTAKSCGTVIAMYHEPLTNQNTASLVEGRFGLKLFSSSKWSSKEIVLHMFRSKRYFAFKTYFPNHWSHITSLAVVGPSRNRPNNHFLGEIVFWVGYLQIAKN